jgi:hypothetical protein
MLEGRAAMWAYHDEVHDDVAMRHVKPEKEAAEIIVDERALHTLKSRNDRRGYCMAESKEV